MARMFYVINTSLDGFIEDEEGDFQWGEPDDERFGFITDLLRPVGTQLFGRRMYEAMAVWETDRSLAAQTEAYAEFARVWQANDKIVYSTTLDEVSTARTRLERRFDPEAVASLKQGAGGDLMVSGPTLAAHTFHAGLVDECHLFVLPVIVGGGKPALPSGMRASLELVDERRFADGSVYVHHRILQ